MPKKPNYFDVEKFVAEVIDAMKLGNVTTPVLMELRSAIETRLSDRIMATIVNAFTDRDMNMFQNALKDHPEIDEIDALMMIAPNIEGLNEKMEKNINSLYSELVYDAEKIDEAMKARKK